MPVFMLQKGNQICSPGSILFFEWPAGGPDLQPIESVWGTLARTIFENSTVRN